MRAKPQRRPFGVGDAMVIALQPGLDTVRRMLRLPRPDILSAATNRWDLAAGSSVVVRRAKFLPGQLERIRAARFGSISEVARDFLGGFESPQGPTVAYQLKDVVLHDGVLYSGKAVRHLKPRSGQLLKRFDPVSLRQAAMYESWLGNRWFGNWLSDDCLAYRLAEFVGQPVTTESPTWHKSDYERLLAISAQRVSSCRFEELILFDDQPHNESKRWRTLEMRRRLVGTEPPRHPGVFLRRGSTAEARVLRNEQEVAERLALQRGFRILEPHRASVAEIIAACAGAQVVAGVEGSHLVHGLMVMPAGARVLVIQPPQRAVSVLKLITDRQEQDYSFVVGAGSNAAFSANADEIERTLDLA